VTATWACPTQPAICATARTRQTHAAAQTRTSSSPTGGRNAGANPPVGTINLDGGRNPEIYVGNGEWVPLEG